MTDVLTTWNENDNPHDTVAILMDYALAWQKEGRGEAWRQQYESDKFAVPEFKESDSAEQEIERKKAKTSAFADEINIRSRLLRRMDS